MTLLCKYRNEHYHPFGCNCLREGSETKSLSSKHQVMQSVTTPDFNKEKNKDGSLEIKDKDLPKKTQALQ